MAPVPTVSQLVARYPELEAGAVDHPELIQSALEEAAAYTSDSIFPTTTAQLYYTLTKAAILLYQSPYARELRLDVANGPKTKDLERWHFKQAQAATLGIRVFAFLPALFFLEKAL